MAISVDGLDAHCFDDNSDGSLTNVWGKSLIRTWLNGDGFYNRVLDDGTLVFTEDEKSFIKPVTLDNMSESDNVFLLSGDIEGNGEANEYFEGNEARRCKTTEYAVANGANTYNGYCIWCLRSNNPFNVNDVWCVSRGGKFGSCNVDAYELAVRPAIWIKL